MNGIFQATILTCGVCQTDALNIYVDDEHFTEPSHQVVDSRDTRSGLIQTNPTESDADDGRDDLGFVSWKQEPAEVD